MARTGTLTEACYHKELRPSVNKACNGAIDSEQESMELDTYNTDEVLGYGINTDKQKIIQNKIGNEATFLLGANLWFGRSIKSNRKCFGKF